MLDPKKKGEYQSLLHDLVVARNRLRAETDEEVVQQYRQMRDRALRRLKEAGVLDEYGIRTPEAIKMGLVEQ